jgi:hypothetical protein
VSVAYVLIAALTLSHSVYAADDHCCVLSCLMLLKQQSNELEMGYGLFKEMVIRGVSPNGVTCR